MERKWMIEARELKGLSKSDLAKQIKVVRSYIHGIENGAKTPSGKVALKLSRILDVKMERFFEDQLEEELEKELAI
ncbi:helix-turn-helix transcriptional regulator [Peribacillus frigoritolerans]|uniref:helix-turn-helix transcriptional regulator n=1 Tax=Peribacillus frigoritolerans TaxID=450367 RepID=UPI002079F4A0|nr:helix-turn-helix transcriptional regulator [Peribacillus frigoritolerans]USK77730.1 helix-turn-helix domain-containing protein [Peribacillus frigoritolerans]